MYCRDIVQEPESQSSGNQEVQQLVIFFFLNICTFFQIMFQIQLIYKTHFHIQLSQSARQ